MPEIEISENDLGIGEHLEKKPANALGEQSVIVETRSQAEQLRETDPRDYIRVTTFQKHSRSIDPDSTHPWEREPYGYSWSKDNSGEVVASLVYDSESRQKHLLIAEKASDQEASATYIEGIDPAVRDFTADVIRVVGLRFPPSARYEAVRSVIAFASRIRETDPNTACFSIATRVLKMLPDDPRAQPIEAVALELPSVDFGVSDPTAEQKQALDSLFVLLSRKMPRDSYDRILKTFLGSVPSTDNIYGGNFKYVFSDAVGWVVSARKDTPIDEAASARTGPDRQFPVKDLVKEPIRDTHELEIRLSALPVKREPDVRSFPRSEATAEFVDLEKVVGGPGITEWTTLYDPSQKEADLEKTLRFAQMIQTSDEAGEQLLGRSDTMQASEYKGEYYLGNARHRVVALKALGVPFVPMLVTHIGQT
jgi:hypothetical protein